MREIVRIELPLSHGLHANRTRGARTVVRTKSGNVLSAPTPSSQPPSVSSTICAGETSCCEERTFSPQFSAHSSIETVLLASSSCDSSGTFVEEQQQQQIMESASLIPPPPSFGLRLDIPNQVINEVSDLEESNGAAYDSDDSLKDLNWLGGLNPSKIGQAKAHASSSSSSSKKHQLLQSPRRNQQPAVPASAPSPRNRASSTASMVMPYIKRISLAPTVSPAGTALSPIRQSSPTQPELASSNGNFNSITNVSNLQTMQLPGPNSLMSSSVPVSQMISHPPWVTQQREARRLNRLKRPPFSYIALCCMALASSETLTLPLTQLYKWIEDSFPYYARPECYQDWRSSIRHTLSLYTFFQSAPIIIGRKTIPTWRLDITEPERQEIVKLVGEYQQHLNSQFISEWTSRLVYAEQRSHRRGAYDRQASRFKAFSALRSRSSSTDTLTSTHSTSTSATAQSTYQSFTPDSGMSSVTSISGPTPLTISEADISLLSGALTSITAATVNNTGPMFHSNPNHRRMSPAPVMFCGTAPGCTSLPSTSMISSPAHSSNATTTTYETGPGITIIRIPPNAGKFGLLVLAPQPQQGGQQSATAPATPLSIMSDQSNLSSAPLFDLTNQGFSVHLQQQQMQQNGGSPSTMASPPSVITLSSVSPGFVASNNNGNGELSIQYQPPHNDFNTPMQLVQSKEDQQHMQFMAEYHSQLAATSSPIAHHHHHQQQQLLLQQTTQQHYLAMEPTTVDNSPRIDSVPINVSSNNFVDCLPNGGDVDFGSSMELDLSLQEFVGSADELFADAGNIDFAAMLDGALDTPRSVLLPQSDGGML